jgi:hypothetical protein
VFDPVEGLHYPGSTGDFLAWFSSDVDCLDYLSWLRWPLGSTDEGPSGGMIATNVQVRAVRPSGNRESA